MTVPNVLQKQVLAWSEDKLQEEIRSAAVEHGWLEYHTYDSRRSTPGFPDLVLVHPRHGALVFRELKRQGKSPTAKQQEWLDSLSAAGQDVGVWRPEDWVSGSIQRLLVQGPPRA